MKKFAIRGQHYCQRALNARNISSRTVVFLRHGESEWNREKRFSGWSDIPLTETGIKEARRAGKILKKEGFEFDVCYTSYLTRTIQTFNHAAQEMDALHLPLVKSWKLNERHYGALQGLSKVKAVKQHGKQTVQRWRRDYDYPPPAVDLFDKRHPAHERKYKGVPCEQLPTGESLKETMRRVIPYWQQEIVPEVEAGRSVLIVAHENSLRGIIKLLDRIGDQGVTQLQIPTGIPLVYEFDENMEKMGHYYLAEQNDLEHQMAKIKGQIQN